MLRAMPAPSLAADKTPSQLLWRRMWQRRTDMVKRMDGFGGRLLASAADMRDMFREAWTCPLCSTLMTWDSNQPTSAEFDHVVPLGKGGDHSVENMRVICRGCHQYL